MADHDMGEACPHTARIYVEVTTIFDSIDSTGYMLPVCYLIRDLLHQESSRLSPSGDEM